MTKPPFHLAIAVDDLARARAFYTQVLACGVGREAERWVDLNFHGHQLVLHQVLGSAPVRGQNPVDGDGVPVPHFGLVLDPAAWRELADRILRHGIPFIIAPRERFRGKVGRQWTFFIEDPAGNAIECKAFEDPSQLFAREN